MTKLGGVRAGTLAILVGFGVPSLAVGQGQPVPAPPARAIAGSPVVSPDDERALRDLITRFYDARARKDMTAFRDLWFSKAPRRPFNNYPPEIAFPYHRLEAAGAPSLSRLVNKNIYITARVSVPVTITVRPNDKPQAMVWVRDMQFFKDGEAWTVYSETPAAESLAMDLVRVKGADERQKLLDAEPALFNEDLLFALEMQIDRLMLGGGRGQAIDLYEFEMKLADQMKNPAGVARTEMKIGQALQITRDPAAVPHLQKALEGFTALGDRPHMAKTQIALGASYYMVDDQMSRDHYKAGVDILENESDKGEFARALHGYGNACYMTGAYGEATDAYRRSMEIQQAAGVKSAMPALLQSLGRVQKAQGDYDAALESYEKSMADPQLLDNTVIFGGRSGRADVYRLQGRFDVALEELGGLLALVKGWNDKQSLMRLEADIGNVYMGEQQPTSALDHYRQSLTLAEQLGNQAGIARAVSGAGAAYFADQRFDLALEAFNRGLGLYETLRDKGSVAWTYAHIALAQSAVDKHDEAIASCQKALDICSALNDRAAAAAMQTLLAMQKLELEQYDQAIDLADRAAKMARENQSYDTLAQARLVTGHALRKKDDREGARAAYADAIGAVETARDRAGEDARDDFFGDNRGPYKAMALLMAAGGGATDALMFAERSQIGMLSNVLTGNRGLLVAGMSAEEQEQERQINRTLKSLRTQVQKEQDRTAPDAARLETLKAKLTDTDRQRKAFYERVYGANPSLKLQRGFLEPASLDDMAALAADAKTAVLEFVTTDRQTLLIAVTKPAEIHAYPIELTASELSRRIRDFRLAIAKRDKDVGTGARELYDLLLGPAREVLAGKTRLLLVPDGPLWAVPFQALQDHDGKYLVQSASISYAPSLTALSLIQRGALSASATVPGRQVVLVGNAQVGTAAERLGLLQPRASLKPMPNAEQEARKVALLYGPKRAKAFIGKTARPEAVYPDLRAASLMHLATFFVPSAASPLHSPIVLSDPGNGQPANTIEAWDLMRNRVPPRMVIARVQSERAVGEAAIPVGLSWTFAVGGARSTLLATWPDDSPGAMAVMTGLHRALAAPRSTPLPLASALRQAILPTLATEFRHPFYWANYAVIGID